MAEVLHGSKYNLTNDDEICEAEKEILKSMDAEEVMSYSDYALYR